MRLREKERMKYKIVTYGCQMNIHESEKVAGILENMGYILAGEEESADVVVFNTCCIRDTAEKRALGNIGVIKAEKRKNPDMVIVVFGCMPAQPGVADMIKEKYPYVDIVLGTRNLNILENFINVWAPPGICIVIAVLGFNFVGDGLRDALDPKARR